MDYGMYVDQYLYAAGSHPLLGEAYRFNAWDLYESNVGLREVL